MKGHFYRPNCKCPKDKKCKCGAKWGFLIDIGINPQTGKRKQKFRGGFKTKKEAEAAAASFLLELNNGTFVEEKNISFEQFAQDWLKGYKGTGRVKISTIRVRQHEINRLMPYFAKLKMKDISKKNYQDALLDLKEKGYADNTLDGVHRTGRMIFKKAVEQDVIKIDPTQYAYVPKIQKTIEELETEEQKVRYLEKEELSLLLQTAKEKGLELDYIVFKTLAYTGMRAGELCALKWKDINFEEQTISITKTYYNPTNNTTKYQLLPPKTLSAKRDIIVDEELLDSLEEHRATQNIIRMKHRKTYYDKDFVFAKMDINLGYPLYIKAIENRMRRLLKLAGLNKSLTPHSLRHTHTSLLAEAGVELHEIMDRLGHKDDETTKNVYLHVTNTKKQEASHKFAELMRSLR